MPLVSLWARAIWNGPGDIPPGDDYPLVSAADADLDDPQVVSPSQFSVETLSAPNAAVVSAHRYLFWGAFQDRFDELRQLLYVNAPTLDNPLVRADVEVLVALPLEPRTIADFRSFDLMFDKAHPRVRVYAGGVAYAFPFKKVNRGSPEERLAMLKAKLADLTLLSR